MNSFEIENEMSTLVLNTEITEISCSCISKIEKQKNIDGICYIIKT